MQNKRYLVGSALSFHSFKKKRVCVNRESEKKTERVAYVESSLSLIMIIINYALYTNTVCMFFFIKKKREKPAACFTSTQKFSLLSATY